MITLIFRWATGSLSSLCDNMNAMLFYGRHHVYVFALVSLVSLWFMLSDSKLGLPVVAP